MAEFSIPQRVGALLRENPELVGAGPIPGIGVATTIAKNALPSLGDISEAGQYLGATVVPAVGGAVGDFLSGIGSGTDPRKVSEAFAAEDQATEQPLPAGAVQLQAFRPPDETDTPIQTGPKPAASGGGLFGAAPGPAAPAPVTLTQQELAAIQSLPMASQRQQAARALIARKRAMATAGGQGGPGFATTTTTTTTGAAVDPRVAQQLVGEQVALTKEKQRAVEQKAESSGMLSADTERLHKQWQAEHEQYRKTVGEKGDAVHSRFVELDREFDAMRKDLADTKISPLGGFDKTSQALLVVAAALEGGGAAMRRRPSNLGAAIGHAINTDLASQRANLRTKLHGMRLTERQRDQALARYDELENRKRVAAFRAAQLQTAEIATKQKGIDNKFAAAQTALDLRDRLNMFKATMAEKSKARTVTRTTKAPTGGQALAGKLDNSDRTRLDGYDSFLGEFEAYADRLSEQSGEKGLGYWNRAVAVIPGTDENIVNKGQHNIAMALTKAKSGAQATDAERATQLGRVPAMVNDTGQRRAMATDLLSASIAQATKQARDRFSTGNRAAGVAFAQRAQQLVKLKRKLTGPSVDPGSFGGTAQ